MTKGRLKIAMRYMEELGATPKQAAQMAYRVGRKGKKGNTFGLRRSIVGACPNTKLTKVIVGGKEV